MLSETQKQRVFTVFDRIASDPDPFVSKFFDCLIARAPAIRDEFPTTLQARCQWLAKILSFVIDGIDDIQNIHADSFPRGAGHSDHTPIVVAALLDSFAAYVPDWGGADRAAWYMLLSARIERVEIFHNRSGSLAVMAQAC